MLKFESSKISRILGFVSLLLLAIALRLMLFHISSGDIDVFVGVWYDTFINVGRIAAFKDIFYDYSPAYLYLVDFSTLFRFIPKEQAIKLISVLFDFLAASAVYKIAAWKFPQSDIKWIGFFATLFTPTVVIDSAMWGQNDIIYSAFLLWSFYFLLKEKPFPAILFFSIAVSFKLQAAFFAPIFLILLTKRKFPFHLFFVIPIVYFISLIPAWLAGGPLAKLMMVYLNQYGAYSDLSLHAPNFYSFINPGNHVELKLAIGIILTGLVVSAYIVLRWLKWKDLSDISLCFDAVFFTTVIPFFLPKMHERYFFTAGLFLLVLALFNYKYLWAFILMQATSLLSYLPYFSGWSAIYVQIGAVMNALLLLGLFFFYLEYVKSRPPILSTENETRNFLPFFSLKKALSQSRLNPFKNRNLAQLAEIILILYIGVVFILEIKLLATQPLLKEINITTVWSEEMVGDHVENPPSPLGLAVDQNGQIYVTDRGNQQVIQFSAAGKIMTTWSGDDTGQTPFVEPSDIAIDAESGNIWILDAGNGWIYTLGTDGKMVAAINGANLQMYSPRGLAISPGGDIFVADTGMGRIQRLDQQGNRIAVWGEPGTKPDQFLEPTGIAIQGNDLFIADANNQCIKHYTLDGKLIGTFKSGLGTAWIDTDGHGHIFAASTQTQKITIYDYAGKPISELLPEKEIPSISGLAGIVATEGGQLYAAGAVELFQFKIQW
ncbi:MAG TPA: glycosyltransferase 87 family protein [Longilinea sp.]|nr:glycosyltransferase 87 family protein [Longilinea sp.]